VRPRERGGFWSSFCDEWWRAQRATRGVKGGTEIVYDLYGLTDEEIEIVEEAVADD
jgi:hypothetical protein